MLVLDWLRIVAGTPLGYHHTLASAIEEVSAVMNTAVPTGPLAGETPAIAA